MTVLNSIVKWSFYTSTVFTFLVLGSFLAVWLGVETLALLIHYSD